jgi:hypothetical protein
MKTVDQMRRDAAASAHSVEFDPDLYYKKGRYTCDKGEVDAPNCLVYFAARRLDADPQVTSFTTNGAAYQFYHPAKKTILQGWFDFDVRMKDHSRRLLYVTSAHFVQTRDEEAKIEGAECAATDHKARFELWTEFELFGEKPEYMRSVVRFIMDRLYLLLPLERNQP